MNEKIYIKPSDFDDDEIIRLVKDSDSYYHFICKTITAYKKYHKVDDNDELVISEELRDYPLKVNIAFTLNKSKDYMFKDIDETSLIALLVELGYKKTFAKDFVAKALSYNYVYGDDQFLNKLNTIICCCEKDGYNFLTALKELSIFSYFGFKDGALTCVYVRKSDYIGFFDQFFGKGCEFFINPPSEFVIEYEDIYSVLLEGVKNKDRYTVGQVYQGFDLKFFKS